MSKRRKKGKHKRNKKARLPSALNELAWDMARIMTKMVKPAITDGIFFCPECDDTYRDGFFCIGAGGYEVHCNFCHYSRGCFKPILGRRTCQQCERR